MVKCGEVYWVELDPTVGSEIRKTRPCLVISPDDMNQALPRVIIAPITSWLSSRHPLRREARSHLIRPNSHCG